MTQSQTLELNTWSRGLRWVTSAVTLHQNLADYVEPLAQMIWPGWQASSWRARVLEVRPEQADVYTLVLRPSASWKGFVAGQYIELSAEKNGARAIRCFSISSSPAHYRRTGLIELTIREQQGGLITPWLKQAFAGGGGVNISAAKGEFLWPQGDKPLLMIAGGSGITPFRSMLQEAAARSSTRAVHLMYYARDAHSWLFHEEFQKLMLSFPGLTLSFMDSDVQGFISAQHLHDFCPDFVTREVMICGPSAMIGMARDICADAGSASDHIHFEYFGAAPLDMPEAADGSYVVSFEREGKAVATDSDAPQTLLDVAEANGLKPVSGCRMGVCHQCICQKKSGVVFNTQTGRYSDTGPGEIQLCVSVASSDVILDL